MASSETIASLATAAGTLVLAAATFASVRSANKAARTAERSFQVALRPLLMHSRPTDPAEKIMWVDRHWAKVEGGRGVVELIDGNIYLAMSVRNAGSGIAVIQGWSATAGWLYSADPHAPPEDFRRQTRDLYIPAGDVGFWQGAIREVDDPQYESIAAAIKAGDEGVTMDLLYTDHEGGQRTISRFSLTPRQADDIVWLVSANRHWNLDRADPPLTDRAERYREKIASNVARSPRYGSVSRGQGTTRSVTPAAA